MKHCRPRIPVILESLREDSQSLYEFLGILIEINESGPSTPVKTNEEEDYLSSQEVYEAYIELMCQFDEVEVCAFLKSHDNYSVERISVLVDKLSTSDAKIYILEKENRITEAHDLLMREFQEKIDAFQSPCEDDDQSSCMSSLSSHLSLLISFCERHSVNTDLVGRESLWCPVLDRVLALAIKAKKDSEKSACRALVRNVTSSLLGQVGHSKVLGALLGQGGSEWGDLSNIITELLRAFRYESQLLESSKLVMEQERASLLAKRVTLGLKGLYSQVRNCTVCGSSLASQADTQCLVFRCGHSFLSQCLYNAGGLSVSSLGEEVWTCVECNVPKVNIKVGGTTTRTGEDFMNNPGSKGDVVSEEVKEVRKHLELYQRGDKSSQLFEEKYFIFSDKFHLRLKPEKP